MAGKTCPTCGLSPSDQHSLAQGGRCDGIRNGYLDKAGYPTGKTKKDLKQEKKG